MRNSVTTVVSCHYLLFWRNVCVCAHVCAVLCLTLCDPMDSSPTRHHCPWNFPGKKTGAGCHFLLQGIFPPQGSNLCLLHLLHWQVDSLPLQHLGIRNKEIYFYWNVVKFPITSQPLYRERKVKCVFWFWLYFGNRAFRRNYMVLILKLQCLGFAYKFLILWENHIAIILF